MKKSPSFFSTWDLPPFFEEEEEQEEEAADVDVDGMLLDPGNSDSSHMYESAWQIPSSTSGLRLRYPTLWKWNEECDSKIYKSLFQQNSSRQLSTFEAQPPMHQLVSKNSTR